MSWCSLASAASLQMLDWQTEIGGVMDSECSDEPWVLLLLFDQNEIDVNLCFEEDLINLLLALDSLIWSALGLTRCRILLLMGIG